ncbi:MAG: cation:proton antiporter [Candidatus Sedimenticola sp. (ex Thyasira tokunagai)]
MIKRVPALTPRGFIAYKQEAHYLGLFANAVVFISMANLLDFNRILTYWPEILVVFILITLIRALFVFPFITLTSLPKRWAAVLTLAGMKGGLAIIMAHSLPETFAYREMFEAIVIGNVLLSIFLYSFLMMAYLHYHHEGFENDRREQDPEPDLEELARQFQQIVEKNPITHLYIPSVFEEIVGNEIGRATRYGMELSMVMLDTGPKKEDGSSSKDLATLAEIVGDETRASDLSGHHGSRGIGIVTTNTNADGAMILVRRIQDHAKKVGLANRVRFGISDLAQGDTTEILIEKTLASLEEVDWSQRTEETDPSMA